MTLTEAISAADAVKPNAFDAATKSRWLSDVEGDVQLRVLLTDPDELTRYVWPDDADTALLAAPPHDRLYVAYLLAMIDFSNGDLDRYQASAAMFNGAFRDYMRWYAQTYRPADRH